MEIRVIKAFMHGGKRVEPDDVIDLPAADAAYVIGLGKADAIDSDVAPAKKSKAKAKAE